MDSPSHLSPEQEAFRVDGYELFKLTVCWEARVADMRAAEAKARAAGTAPISAAAAYGIVAEGIELCAQELTELMARSIPPPSVGNN